MSHNPKLSQRIQPHEATPWVIEAIRAIETSGELAQGEIDRLTRELAEAKARAVPSWTETKFALDAWLKQKGIFDDDTKAVFAAAAWKACWDFMMLSARPESPPNGLPSKESDQQKPEVSYE